MGEREMKTFASLANEDWRIIVSEYDVSEPTICYPDSGRRGAFVGPLVTVHVGTTLVSDDGSEILELDGANGRNLYAVACLPHFAELFSWIRKKISEIGVSESNEFNEFIDSLLDRVDWIEATINERDMEIGADSVIGLQRWGD